MIKFNETLFALGWVISGVLFFWQWFQMIRTKKTEGLSLISSLGFGLLNINSTIWLYRHHQYWSIPGAIMIFLFCLSIAYYLYKYDIRFKKKFKAVIFDLDGTIFYTQDELHAYAEAKVLERYGIIIDPKSISKKYAGISTKKVFAELAPNHDPGQLVNEKWDIVKTWLNANDPKPVEGVIKALIHLNLFHPKIGLAIASASPKWYIEKMLNKTVQMEPLPGQLISIVQLPLHILMGMTYVSAEDVPSPKPAPDVFLKAAEMLGVAPKDCLVIGDGRSDVYGGLAAGMSVYFIGEPEKDLLALPKLKIFNTDSELYEHVEKINFRNV